MAEVAVLDASALVDALYAALADELGDVPLLTTDAGLAANVASAELLR